jgi:hypothetical protein
VVGEGNRVGGALADVGGTAAVVLPAALHCLGHQGGRRKSARGDGNLRDAGVAIETNGNEPELV